jgi:DNA helicase II / ATP-dependent DNA helicase PcrA
MASERFASDEEIKIAEKILIGGEPFDEDKKTIIVNNNTIDIKACPGSGKTTTLLAKLIILSNRLPLANNQGICVLTHTNVAIDEIKDKLGTKADSLFNYPNHFGTIQSFVDKYLASPQFKILFGKSFRTVSDEAFGNDLTRSILKRLGDLKTANNSLYSKIWYYLFNKIDKSQGEEPKDFLIQLRFEIIDNVFQVKNIKTDKNLTFSKPHKKRQKSYSDWTDIEKEEIKEWFKQGFINSYNYYGSISYHDAYSFANNYLIHYKNLRDAFSQRFKYVFIDEMQDTDAYQIAIFDKLFNIDKVILQRFGDPHQAIFNRVKAEEIWELNNPLPINTSKRFGENIAKVLRTICIVDNNTLKPNNEILSLEPRIIVFENPSEVLPKYCSLLETLKIKDRTIDEIAKEENKKIKAIGWVGDKERIVSELTVKSYFKEFRKELKRKDTTSYTSLKTFFKKKINSDAKFYSDNIYKVLLHILYLGSVKYNSDQTVRNYNKTLLSKVLKDTNQEQYLKLTTKIADWTKRMNKSLSYDNSVIQEVKDYIRIDFYQLFGVKTNSYLNSFIDNESLSMAYSDEEIKSNNVYVYPINNKISVEIGTIHSAKGETHAATLYLETYYQGKYESESIADQLKGKTYTPPKGKKDTYIKETLKMAYVGMSRPKYLLCLAIHKDRFLSNYDIQNGGCWVIEKTY